MSKIVLAEIERQCVGKCGDCVWKSNGSLVYRTGSREGEGASGMGSSLETIPRDMEIETDREIRTPLIT